MHVLGIKTCVRLRSVARTVFFTLSDAMIVASYLVSQRNSSRALFGDFDGLLCVTSRIVSGRIGFV